MCFICYVSFLNTQWCKWTMYNLTSNISSHNTVVVKDSRFFFPPQVKMFSSTFCLYVRVISGTISHEWLPSHCWKIPNSHFTTDCACFGFDRRDGIRLPFSVGFGSPNLVKSQTICLREGCSGNGFSGGEKTPTVKLIKTIWKYSIDWFCHAC